ncbi:hypothetical protein EYZ11_005995 [Aspergillus tanneri]|nr:hypothetical protein EYZ11_005995 [Aspergillus tanneri]
MFRAICEENFYGVDDGKIRTVARHFEEGIRQLSRVKVGPAGLPALTTSQPDMKARRRFNSPWQNEHLHDRASLFIDKVYGADQTPSQYPTSFAVTREIFFAFFGKEPLHSMFVGEPSTIERTAEFNPLRQESLTVSEETSAQVQTEIPAANTVETEEAASGLSPDDTIDLQPHPPGTPDRMAGVENDVPFAAGFEEHISKAPLKVKSDITLHRKAMEILRIWYEYEPKYVIVLFIFESRTYYKFPASGGDDLRDTLEDLSKEHYFLVCRESRIVHPDLNQVYEDALQYQLILVAKRNCPLRDVDYEDGRISVDKLIEYMTHYDVRTGKRKATGSDTRATKRPVLQ